MQAQGGKPWPEPLLRRTGGEIGKGWVAPQDPQRLTAMGRGPLFQYGLQIGEAQLPSGTASTL